MNLGAMRMAFVENVWDPAIWDGVFEQMQMSLRKPASRIHNYNCLWATPCHSLGNHPALK